MADETGIVVVEPGKDGQQPTLALEGPDELKEFIDVKARDLGGNWDFHKGRLKPMSETLVSTALARGIAMIWPERLDSMTLIYYPVAAILSALYGLVIADLQGWEGWFYWFGGAAIAAAFFSLSRAVNALWEGYAIAKYRELARDIQARRRTALGLTAAFAIVDYAANVLLLTRAGEIASLGAPPHPVVIALASAVVTLGAVSLPVTVGLNRGVRDEVHAFWWQSLRAERPEDLHQLDAAWAKLDVVQANAAAADTYPLGHPVRNGRR